MNKTTKAVRFDSQREGTFKTEMEIFETKWIALLLGTSIQTSSIDVFKREVIAVNAGGGGASLSLSPKSGSLSIFKATDANGIILGTEQISGNPGTTENTYSISGTDLTFNATTFASSGYVIAHYLVNQSKPNFTVDNISFPGGYTIYADAKLRDTQQNDKYVQYQLLNAKPKSNASLSMDSANVAKLSIEWDLLANSAGNIMSYVEV